MARIFQDGFEMGLPAPHGTTVFGAYLGSMWQFYQNNVNSSGRSIGVVTDIKNSGVYSLRIYYDRDFHRISVFRNLEENLVEHYGRVELRSGVSSLVGIIHFRDEDFNVVGSIRLDNLHSIKAYVGNTEVGSINNAITPGAFSRVEWHLLIGETGLFEIKINGNTTLSWEGDTDPLSTGNIRYLCLGHQDSGNFYHTTYYDDIAINDTTGTVNNSWVGKGSILLLKPKADGHYSQFTANSGSDNFNRVNQIPHDGDTTYVESDTPEEIDTYELEELIADKGIDPDSIVKAIQICFTGRYEESDAHLAPMLRSGVSDLEGNKVTLAGSYYRAFQQIFSINPFTSNPWIITDVDSLEAGVKYKEHLYD